MKDRIPAADRPCAKCGTTPRKPGSSYCVDCWREYYRLRQRARRKADFTICTICGKRPRAAGKTRCWECIADASRRDAERRARRGEIKAKHAELLAAAAECRDILARMKAGQQM